MTMMTMMNLLRPTTLVVVAFCLCNTHALMCVKLQKYENPDCTGNVVQTLKFPTWETPGSPCFPFTVPAETQRLWIRDQYCNTSDGTFLQKVYGAPDCQGEQFEQQVFTTDSCLYRYKLESKCTDGTVTLLKFDNDNCSGDAVERNTFTVSLEPGSTCFAFDIVPEDNPTVIHIKDQYCTDQGIFKQTVFASSDTCDDGEGGKEHQEYSTDTCLYGYKLAEPCGHDAICLDNSNGAMILGATALVSVGLLSFLLIKICCRRNNKIGKTMAPVSAAATTGGYKPVLKYDSDDTDLDGKTGGSTV